MSPTQMSRKSVPGPGLRGEYGLRARELTAVAFRGRRVPDVGDAWQCAAPNGDVVAVIEDGTDAWPGH